MPVENSTCLHEKTETIPCQSDETTHMQDMQDSEGIPRDGLKAFMLGWPLSYCKVGYVIPPVCGPTV